MKFLSIVGARPQFVKLAPVGRALAASEHRHVVVHTGQHYDDSMSGNVFSSLDIPSADVHLDVGSGSHGHQTGRMLGAIEDALQAERPDVVVVYGDTNSTIAGTLAASKMLIPVAHVEAGLRSFDRRMPEEQNRLVADHLSEILLAPTNVAMEHLAREGLAARAHLVGDVMADVCLEVAASISHLPVLPAGVDPDDYVVATIHRPSNTDDAERLASVLDYLARVPSDVVLAAHPRLVAKASEHGLQLERSGVHVRTPFDYRELVAAVIRCAAVVTDSGGLQKEAYLLGRPCTTLRAETEWVETLSAGANMLDHALAEPDGVLRGPLPDDRASLFGDGRAAYRIVETVRAHFT